MRRIMKEENKMESKLTKSQKKVTNWREYTNQYGDKCRLKTTLRYDDECGNGHNTFAITASGHEFRDGIWHDSIGGCCHDEIANVVPEYKEYIKWHLVSSDAPLHYVANTVY